MCLGNFWSPRSFSLIDGYFSSDPTADTKNDKNSEPHFYNMIRRITTRNDFEKFLNSNIKLSYLLTNEYDDYYSLNIIVV